MLEIDKFGKTLKLAYSVQHLSPYGITIVDADLFMVLFHLFLSSHMMYISMFVISAHMHFILRST